jgi:hypothetical protein
MALTASFQDKGDFEVAEEGRYVCQLSGVKREDRPSFDDPNVLEPNFVWEFETLKERDSKDRPFKFFNYTKTAYGNEKAKLTLLINGLFGRAFIKEQVAQMDFEKLVGKTVGVMVGTTSSGKNKVLSVKFVPSKPIAFEDVTMPGADRKVTPPSDDDLPDPFADD